MKNSRKLSKVYVKELNTVHNNLVVAKHLDGRLEDAIQNHHQGFGRLICERDVQLDVTALIRTGIHTPPVVSKVPLKMSVTALELVVANRQDDILTQQVIALVQRHEFPEAVARLESGSNLS